MSLCRLFPWALAFTATGLFTSAGAQEVDASHYDGSWSARFPCRSGKGTCPARLVISDFAGTWQDLSPTAAAKRMCAGKKMSLTLQNSTRSQLAFTVFGDGVSESCPTLSIFVKPVDGSTLAGTVEIGQHAIESPEVHASHAGASARADADAARAGASPANAIRLERR